MTDLLVTLSTAATVRLEVRRARMEAMLNRAVSLGEAVTALIEEHTQKEAP